jgi:hypothetical protein
MKKFSTPNPKVNIPKELNSESLSLQDILQVFSAQLSLTLLILWSPNLIMLKKTLEVLLLMSKIFMRTNIYLIFSEIGMNGLWRGLGTRIFMIGTLTGFQWWIYDTFKSTMGLGTTGGSVPTPVKKN